MKKLCLLFLLLPALLKAGEVNLEVLSKAAVATIKTKTVDERLLDYLPETQQWSNYSKAVEYFYVPESFDIKKPEASFKELQSKNVDRFYNVEIYNEMIDFESLEFVSFNYEEQFNEFPELKLNIWVKDASDYYLIEVNGFKKFDGEWLIMPALDFNVTGLRDEKSKVGREVFRIIRSENKGQLEDKVIDEESYAEIDRRMLAGYENIVERMRISEEDQPKYKKMYYEDKLPPQNFDSLGKLIVQSVDEAGLDFQHLKFYKVLGHSYEGGGSGEDKLGHYKNMTIQLVDTANRFHLMRVNAIYTYDDSWVLAGALKWKNNYSKWLPSRIAEGEGTKNSPFVLEGEGTHIIAQNPIATDTSYFLLKGLNKNMQVTLKHQFDYDGNTYTDAAFSEKQGVFFKSSSYYSGPEETRLFEYDQPETPTDIYIEMIKKIDKEDENAQYLRPLEFTIAEYKQ